MSKPKVTLLPPGPQDIFFQECSWDPELRGGYDNKPLETDHLSSGHRYSLSRKAYDAFAGIKAKLEAN